MQNRKHRPSIRAKLIAPMLITALVPLIIFALATLSAISRSNQTEARLQTDKLLKRVTEEINSLNVNAQTAARTLTESKNVRNAYRELALGLDLSDELECYYSLSDSVKMASQLADFDGIRLYLPNSPLLTHEQFNFIV